MVVLAFIYDLSNLTVERALNFLLDWTICMCAFVIASRIFTALHLLLSILAPIVSIICRFINCQVTWLGLEIRVRELGWLLDDATRRCAMLQSHTRQMRLQAWIRRTRRVLGLDVLSLCTHLSQEMLLWYSQLSLFQVQTTMTLFHHLLKLNNTKLNLFENKTRRIPNSIHNQDQLTYHTDLVIKFLDRTPRILTAFIIKINLHFLHHSFTFNHMKQLLIHTATLTQMKRENNKFILELNLKLIKTSRINTDRTSSLHFHNNARKYFHTKIAIVKLNIPAKM